MDGHSSSGPVTVLLLAALTSSALGQVSRVYFSVVDPLVLTPPKHGTAITGVVWTHNTNLVVEWLNNDLKFYKLFINRTELDQSTAQLTVSKTMQSDVGEYTVEINNVLQPQVYQATLIKKVPKPAVVVRTPSCGLTSSSCNFTCQGDPTGTQPLTYSWRKVNPDNVGEWELGRQIISLEEAKTKDVKQISCRMENPVGKQESEPLENPMYQKPPPPNPIPLIVGILFSIIVVVGVGVGVWKRDAIKEMFSSDTSGDVGGSDLAERNGSPSVTQPLKENSN